MNFLKESIESKLSQLVENQKNLPANPELHISGYRDQLKLFESAKADLLMARSLLAQSKPMSKNIVWRLVVGIIIFLGFLGLSFYLIWYRQVKFLTKDMNIMAPKDAQQNPASEPQRHNIKKEKT